MNFKRISIEDMVTMMKQSSVNVIDIRDNHSFNAGHIPQSKNINNQNAGNFIEDTSKEDPLMVVCYHGHSSQPAAQYFAAQGFKDVYSLDGGYEVWKLSQPIEQLLLE